MDVAIALFAIDVAIGLVALLVLGVLGSAGERKS